MRIECRIKQTDASKLQDEYAKLVEGLEEAEGQAEDNIMGSPSALPLILGGMELAPDVRASEVLPDDLLKEAIPGNIRKAEHFVAFLTRLVEYLKVADFKFSIIHLTKTDWKEDAHESAPCCCRDPAFFLTAPEGYNFH